MQQSVQEARVNEFTLSLPLPYKNLEECKDDTIDMCALAGATVFIDWIYGGDGGGKMPAVDRTKEGSEEVVGEEMHLFDYGDDNEENGAQETLSRHKK